MLAIGSLVVGLAETTSGQMLTFTQAGSFRVAADTVDIRGAHAFVAGGRTLTVLDVSNPAAPVRVGGYTFPEQIWSFRLVDSYAFVAANFFGLGILDVSSPASPMLRATFKTPGQAKGVAVVGTRVFVADHMTGVDVVDVSSIEKPVGLGSFFVEGYARDVAASSRYAFAVDAPTGLYTFDPARPGPPDAVGQLQSAATPQAIEVLEHGGRVVACVVGGGSLQMYDVTEPAAPAHLATFRTPSGRPTRVAVRGTLAYVADGLEGLQVVDLSTPSKPVIAGSFKTVAPARDVAVGEGLVLLAVGAGEGSEEVVVLRPGPDSVQRP
jgi:hypothetical protein